MTLGVRVTDETAMDHALALARAAQARGEVPVGAVVTDASGIVVGEGRNRRESDVDPTGHAEVVAMREAARTMGSWNLAGCTLVVTLEPCLMCAGALLQARVSRLVFGAWDVKAGAAGSVYDVVRDRRLPSRAEVVSGVREHEAAALLRDFFEGRR
ncbi:MAG TPA: tRNA adenosine(34) deaminase TadA [Microbacterium sp.]|nr:tRNA adenosine(34) deaminase TadA [Microbacterium sp.]